jgi:ABC-type transport system substrate-binding protein
MAAGASVATEAGLNEVANGILPKAHWAYDSTIQNLYPHDPAKARASRRGRLRLRIHDVVDRPTDELTRQRQQVVIAQLQAVGINVMLMGFSVNDAIKSFFTDKSGDALLILWAGRPDPSMTFRDLFSRDSFYNPSRTEPDGYGLALAATEASRDPSVRAKFLSKVQHIVADNASWFHWCSIRNTSLFPRK